jgi:iron complex outermembrane receptor protein
MIRPLSRAAVAAPLLLFAASAHAGPAGDDTLSRVVTVPVVEVSTSRTDARSPQAVSTLSRAQIRRANWGQDTPMALAQLPGAYAYSDAGNGIGYSYLSVRGFPQRRISVMVDGVPLNDPESHEVWWIDLPDLLGSASEVQVQRGVGPALYGAAALGGSVNIETGGLRTTPQLALSTSTGSFGTRRFAIEGAPLAPAGGWQFSGRYSRIETDGYRDQSWSRLWSYAFSAERHALRQSWRLAAFGGPENTHLAYLGVSPDWLAGRVTGNADADRKYNPLTFPGEQDHYFEPHYELVHAWAPAARVTLTQTLFWFDGAGYYDERRTGQSLADYRLPGWATTDTTMLPREDYAVGPGDVLVRDAQGRAIVVATDLVRRREVTNRHYGWIPRAKVAHARGELTLGGELRFHDGHHVGSVLSGTALTPGTEPGWRYYDYHPRTLSAGLFAREAFDATPDVRVTADLAWRHQDYAMRGDRFDGVRFDQSYDFALPRLGLRWTPASRWTAFAAWALGSREPAFRDLYDAEGAGSVPLYRVVDVAAGVYRDPLVKPEHVRHWEAGAEWHATGASLTANLYRMEFRDELVWAGQFNTDLGYPVLGNAARSVHQGVELAAHAERGAGEWTLEADANASFADNHFVHYTEHDGPTAADDVAYDGKPIGFAPATTAHVGGRATWRGWSAALVANTAGRIYVDNTGTDANSIAPRTVLDAVLGASRRVNGATVEATLRIFNLADARYETGGYMDVDAQGAWVPMLTPAAPRNWLAGVRVAW